VAPLDVPMDRGCPVTDRGRREGDAGAVGVDQHQPVTNNVFSDDQGHFTLATRRSGARLPGDGGDGISRSPARSSSRGASAPLRLVDEGAPAAHRRVVDVVTDAPVPHFRSIAIDRLARRDLLGAGVVDHGDKVARRSAPRATRRSPGRAGSSWGRYGWRRPERIDGVVRDQPALRCPARGHRRQLVRRGHQRCRRLVPADGGALRGGPGRPSPPGGASNGGPPASSLALVEIVLTARPT